MKEMVNVIGLGLAGCEAVYQLAKRGILVDAYEMKPTKFSPAHESANFAVFADSLKAEGEKLGLVIHAMHEDIFNSMHRI